MKTRTHLILTLLACLFLSGTASAGEPKNWDALIAQGVQFRLQGNLNQSIDVLALASEQAHGAQGAKAAGELGVSLLQANRYDQAEKHLLRAYQHFSSSERTRYALDLGNLAAANKETEKARRYYKEAMESEAGSSSIRMSAALNLAQMASDTERLSRLAAIEPELPKILDRVQRARFHLNLGHQARQLPSSNATLALAYRNLDQARLLLQDSSMHRLQAETLDSLAQLYEDQQRSKDALSLTRQALTITSVLPQSEAGELPINLEWRQARLSKVLGSEHQALAAYQRAVEHIEALRRDMPIEYENGQSTFRVTLEPIYTGLIDLLLKQAQTQPVASRSDFLRRAIDTIELIKQSEMQDYLGDRCSIDGVRNEGSASIADGTALLYPIILDDRIELLLENKSGIRQHTVPVTDELVRRTAQIFASRLREGAPNFQSSSQKLYDWLIRPLEQDLSESKIQTLVVVPDSVLRLVPMAALHDGEHFLLEKLAVSTVAGISMTNTRPAADQNFQSLVAGMSEPGAVVDKLSGTLVAQITNSQAINDSGEQVTRGLASERTLRSVRLPSTASDADVAMRTTALRDSLSLPNVKQEVQALSSTLKATSLLDEQFTVREFRNEVESAKYEVVHIASHGMFGGNSSSSFIMAYDDLITMDAFQTLFASEKFSTSPIELLSLSACETAEGNDRAPLGIAGAAIKARAKSVMGTLWPVEDNAARAIFEKFYQARAQAGLSKSESLRQAQLELLRNEEQAHPFFWAPFILIGNWR